MKFNKLLINCFVITFGIAIFSSCEKDKEEVQKPTITISDISGIEGNDGTTDFVFVIRASNEAPSAITIDYTTQDDIALAGEDFESNSGVATIEAGSKETSITIKILGDIDFEEDESFKVVLSNAANADIIRSTATGTIENDDRFFAHDDNGYSTPTSYSGYTLVWSDEFDGTDLNISDWNYETGNHGWGNNELQNYVGGTKNAFISNGKLVIEAREESSNGSNYTSARITTQGKQSFKYGRIDIRAKLPQGQGIWPALWMLGESFSTVSWPACGEIDIMEIVGHEPATTHGTVHWDNSGSYASYGDHTSLSSGVFADESHVFSIVWNDTFIKWYLDDVEFHVIDITPAGLSEFHEPFFFIFNIAVGGNWPGSPDVTTIFPQRMVVDYVRVFQLQ